MADTSSLYSGFRVGFGSNFLTDRGDVYSASSVVLHPGYIAGGGGMDMALLYFDAPISDMTFAERYRGDIGATVALDAHMVGFGATGTVADGITGTDGNKRGGHNVIDFESGIHQIAGFHRPGHSKFRDLGILGAPGDSGGFWGIDQEGQFLLTGLIDHASGTPFGLVSYSYKTGGLPLDNAWIDSVTAVPEPSSATFLLLGLSSCLCHRRRRTSS